VLVQVWLLIVDHGPVTSRCVATLDGTHATVPATLLGQV
jgi:hypothetical protein